MFKENPLYKQLDSDLSLCHFSGILSNQMSILEPLYIMIIHLAYNIIARRVESIFKKST